MVISGADENHGQHIQRSTKNITPYEDFLRGRLSRYERTSDGTKNKLHRRMPNIYPRYRGVDDDVSPPMNLRMDFLSLRSDVYKVPGVKIVCRPRRSDSYNVPFINEWSTASGLQEATYKINVRVSRRTKFKCSQCGVLVIRWLCAWQLHFVLLFVLFDVRRY